MAARRIMLRLARAGALLTLMLSVLSGCSMPKLVFDPENLYSLPTLPVKYTELNTQLSNILTDGAEYAPPISGANIQPVQLVDLDGDGREEAVAFFRKPSEERPLKIHIFAADGDSYRQTDLIEGSGTGIYSIYYEDLNADGTMELLVGWKATAEHQVLEVYTLTPKGTELLVRSDYVKYTTANLDEDFWKELVVFRADHQGESVAEYYNWQEDGSFASQSSARLSATMAELSQQGRVTHGTLQDNISALFVTGVTDTPRAITDILAVHNGELVNIVLSEITGVSAEIVPYCALYPLDINGDGLTEVPCPVELLLLTDEDASYRRIDWNSYDTAGKATLALQTYHNVEDGWYLQLPDNWLNQIWVTRSVQADEACVTFCILDNRTWKTEPFLHITAITGSNREARAMRGGRFLLGRQAETIYTAELLAANEEWQHGVTPDQVREAFSLIAAEWSAGDY